MTPEWLTHLPVYLAIGVPLVGAALIVGLRLARPTFQGLWFLGILSALLTLVAVVLARPTGYHEVPLLQWGPASLIKYSPLLLVDSISWPFAVSLATLLLAILLTAVVRLTPGSWRAWAGSLGLTGIGLIAVLAGNPLTLLLAWSALDLLELLVQLFQVRDSSLRQGGVLAFSARIIGSFILILALIICRAQNQEFGFENIPAVISPLLILSAGLRLGVLPIQAPLLEEIPMRRGVGTALRLAPAAAGLVLLARTSATSLAPILVVIFLSFASLTALYSAIAWLMANNELSGRPFWMLGLAALAVASAVRGDPRAVNAWGLVLLLAGSLLFLYSARHPGLNLLVLTGLLASSGAPLTPAWAGTWLFLRGPEGLPVIWSFLTSAIYFFSLALLLLGYLRHTLSLADSMEGREPWSKLVYPLGLGVLPVTHFALGWLNLPDLKEIPLVAWLAGLVVLAIACLAWWWNERDPFTLPGEQTFRGSFAWGASFWGQLLSFNWIYRFAWSLYHQVSQILVFLNALQEGEGGLLWAFLLLLLIFSLAFSRNITAIP